MHRNIAIAPPFPDLIDAIGQDAGFNKFTAEVSAENAAMIRVFERSRLRIAASPNGGVAPIAMRLS
jgi:hypothetical protein